MSGFDPETLKKLKAMGLYSDEQERNFEREKKKKEENEARQQKIKMDKMAERSRSRKGNGGGTTVHREIPLSGIYGKVKSVDVDVRPPEIATAPYNFISLPRQVLASPLDDKIHDILMDGSDEEKSRLSKEEEKALHEAFRQYRMDGDHYTGEIRLNMETRTPIFLGGNGEESFAPTGEPIIAGSTLRGMTKNLFKMVTCGGWRKDEDIKERHLYFRCLMAQNSAPYNKSLNAHYNDIMVGEDEAGKVKKNAIPGFLVKRGSKYFIHPLLPQKLHSIVILDYVKKFNLSIGNQNDIKKSAVRWDGHTAYIQVGLLNSKKAKNWNDRGLRTKEQIEEFFEKTPPRERNKIGKQYYRYMSVDDIDKSKCYEVPAEIMAEYQDDKNRRGMDLVKKNPVKGDKAPANVSGLAAFSSIIPCFFLLDDAGMVKSFGHGQSYRIPYERSVFDAVNDSVKKNVIDFADAVFGRNSLSASWASRVAFDDAVCVKSMGKCETAAAHALMQPNPTSFQLYLKQANSQKLLHWDDAEKPEIRGYKMYWHKKNGHSWQASKKEKENLNVRDENSGEILKKITPLKSGAEFKGKIRFRDLTKEELGALLKVFCLTDGEEDIAYKIGMGKSIGLGSIKITPELYLEDGSCYQTLFSKEGWQDSLKKQDMAGYIQAFENHVKDAGEAVRKSYENTLKEMCQMMDYNNVVNIPNWEPAVAQMDGNTMENSGDDRFLHRNILPSVAKVIKKAKMGLGS